MKITEVIYAYGHENILASHQTTFEITRDKTLSKKGNCIIAVSANKAMVDLDSEFKKRLQTNKAKVTILLEVGNLSEKICAFGHPSLTFLDPTELVIRKSDYMCDRTFAIKADKAACDMSRTFIKKLKDSAQKIRISLILNT